MGRIYIRSLIRFLLLLFIYITKLRTREVSVKKVKVVVIYRQSIFMRWQRRVSHSPIHRFAVCGVPPSVCQNKRPKQKRQSATHETFRRMNITLEIHLQARDKYHNGEAIVFFLSFFFFVFIPISLITYNFYFAFFSSHNQTVCERMRRHVPCGMMNFD